MNKFLEVTLILVALYLVVANSRGFSQAIINIGAAYSNAVRTLQGR